MTKRIAQSRFFIRIFDLFIPLGTWGIITLPIWLSPFHPAVVAYFIIGFNLYFLYKAVHTVYYTVLSYKTIHLHRKIPFAKKVQKIAKSRDIKHFIIIPNYKEPIYKLRSTITAITNSDYPHKNLYLVLAFETREEEAKAKGEELKNRFKDFFKDIIITYHALAEGEVAGKASNQTHGARLVDGYAEERGIDSKDTIITICDADSHLPKNYFSYLTYRYLRDRDRLHHFYWGPVLLYNNFWKLPFFVRMQATLSSILRLAFLSQTDKLIQISTYSTSLWLLKKLDFWDVDIIPEDWHIYFQAFFKFGERVRTIPLYTIINGDAVYSGAVAKTLKNRYEQEKRWAWGVSDIPYAIRMSFATPDIPFWPKFKKIIFLMETHLLWPTSFFVLTISAFIPSFVHPVFKRTVLGFLLPRLTSFILTLSSLMLLLYVYIDIKLRARLDQKTLRPQ